MARQEELPGTESPGRDPELHALGLELYELQTQRMELTKQEKAKRGEVAAALHARKIDHYAVDGLELYLDVSEKAKVSVDKGGEDED